MHEAIVAFAFIAMLTVPCLVTMGGGSSEDDTLSTILERAGAGTTGEGPTK